jgi:hypothetical protein
VDRLQGARELFFPKYPFLPLFTIHHLSDVGLADLSWIRRVPPLFVLRLQHLLEKPHG